jgi:Mg2+-importing ATPase
MKHEAFLKLKTQELFKELGTDGSIGLSSSEAIKLLAKYGNNLLNTHDKYEWLKNLLRRFQNPLVLILLSTGVISLFIDDVESFFIILVVLLVSIGLDYYQERKAVSEVESLKKTQAQKITVIRDGVEQEIFTEFLVVGDIIMLSVGSIIPVDAIIIESKDLTVNQSYITGESFPVEKYAKSISKSSYEGITSCSYLVLNGSTVISGYAKAAVIKTGQKTLLGKVVTSIRTVSPPTSFEISIKDLGMLLVRIISISVFAVLMINIFLHRSFLEAFIFALALAVGLTPELFTMVVTVTMSVGAKQMAKEKVIVKKLIGLQNLGSLDVLCTDKTGTLTEGNVTLDKFCDVNGCDDENVFDLAYANSFLQKGIKNILDQSIINFKTYKTRYTKLDEIAFDFTRKLLSVLVKDGNAVKMITKGIPEKVLERCSYYLEKNELKKLNKDSLSNINQFCDKYYRKGHRILAIAYRDLENKTKDIHKQDENNLILAGFVVFTDPPKKSAMSALSKLKSNNVEIKVLTGDSEAVTLNVCHELNIMVTGCVGGGEINQIDDDTLKSVVSRANVFYGLSPAHKSRIILALKARGHTVGFLGDGVNDASALHVADVGISVDQAVDVAKEASDIILLEHNLDVLHKAVLLGRKTYVNIVKYIVLVCSSNFGNMLSMAVASATLPFLPMLPVQILMNNMLYDLSELSIPLDSIDDSNVKTPKKLSTHNIHKTMIYFGLASSVFDFITFYFLFKVIKADAVLFHTVWFIESIVSQILVFFIIREQKLSLKNMPPLKVIINIVVIICIVMVLPYSFIGKSIGLIPISFNMMVMVWLIVGIYLGSVCVIKKLAFDKNWYI